MPAYQKMPTGDVEMASFTAPPWHDAADSSLRLLWSLITNEDSTQITQRTGIEKVPSIAGKKKRRIDYKLPMTAGFDTLGPVARMLALRKKFEIPDAYFRGLKKSKEPKKPKGKVIKYATGRFALGAEIFEGDTASLERQIKVILTVAKRVGLGVPGQPCRAASMGDIGLPVDRKYKGRALYGNGVVVGIIDDGCALAHWNFIERVRGRGFSSRIQYLWDQGGPQNIQDFPYGRELTKQEIDRALNKRGNSTGTVIHEDKVYADLDYAPASVASHGTRVMDIAAGNGNSLLESDYIASRADIIFVQLPPPAIEGGAVALEQRVLDGARYIFNRAEKLKKPAVVNISYGGYDGPHDGTSPVEAGLDALLSKTGRAVVVSAGNGFEADCHASATMAPGTGWFVRWIVPPGDPTPNDLELWYDANCTLEVRLTSPGAAISPSGWIPLRYPQTPIRRVTDSKIIGYVEHLRGPTSNGDNVAFVSLRPTERALEDMNNAPCPSGTWKVEIRNTGACDATFHAWIRRDDSGRSASARRRQSRFHPEDASPSHTVTGWASGTRTIAVGASNFMTQEVCRYSACGPTRPIGRVQGRQKPDVYAPAEELVGGGGILSASSLSARPTRLNGTSAAAPHVAGLIALMFEYGCSLPKPINLSADMIQAAIAKRAARGSLVPNRRQRADNRVPIKQGDVWAELVSTGKMDFLETMKELFP